MVFRTYVERMWNVCETYVRRMWNVFMTYLCCIWYIIKVYINSQLNIKRGEKRRDS